MKIVEFDVFNDGHYDPESAFVGDCNHPGDLIVVSDENITDIKPDEIVGKTANCSKTGRTVTFGSKLTCDQANCIFNAKPFNG